MSPVPPALLVSPLSAGTRPHLRTGKGVPKSVPRHGFRLLEDFFPGPRPGPGSPPRCPPLDRSGSARPPSQRGRSRRRRRLEGDERLAGAIVRREVLVFRTLCTLGGEDLADVLRRAVFVRSCLHAGAAGAEARLVPPVAPPPLLESSAESSPSLKALPSSPPGHRGTPSGRDVLSDEHHGPQHARDDDIHRGEDQ